MKRFELLPKGRTYYKANLHCHTTMSDGKLTPAAMKQAYQERGYSVVAFTDHNIYLNHEELNDDKFLAIASLETDINEFGSRGGDYSRIRTYHLNWYDTRPDYRMEEKARLSRPQQRYSDMEFINQYISEMKEMGFLCCYNHPYWSLQNYDDYKDLRGLWAMEIYNHGCEVDGMFGYHPQSYDEMMRCGQKLFCVSTDDNHNVDGFDDALCDSFGGYVMIAAKEFSYEGIMQALQAGDFYSCVSPDGRKDAPEIHEMTLTGKELHIECSPADKIFVKTLGRNCYRAAARPGSTITSADFTLQGNEGYIRLDIYDGQGRHTTSNAYFLDDILARTWDEES